MALSLFLAKIFGIYLLTVGIALLFNRKRFVDIFQRFSHDSPAMLIVALVTLILGSLLVVSHNVWIMGWPVLVTIVSWIIFIKGILRMLHPGLDAKWMSAMQSSGLYYTLSIIALILGLVFCYFGFDDLRHMMMMH